MGKAPSSHKPDLSRRSLLVAGAAAVAMPRAALAQGTNSIRIGVPTKTYYPTIIAETALRQKLFEKEGIKAELTIYRGGAEGFEALAAGAADSSSTRSSRRRRPARRASWCAASPSAPTAITAGTWW